MSILRTEDEAREFVRRRATGAEFERLERFAELLATENQLQNLVSPRSLENIWLRHIADSAQLLDHVPRETGRWIDLGSGAGFPGLVLAMLQAEREFLLIEARNLRIRWLRRVTEEIGLGNCTILGMDVLRIPDTEAGVISARAFAPLDRLIALSARFSTATTRWVLPKGRSASQEVAALPPRFRSMFHVKQSVTDSEAGIVVGLGKLEIAA